MSKTAYIHGIILDGTKEMQPQSGKVILVEDKKIIGILPSSECDLSGIDVVDLKGMYVLPGLINLHVHLAGSGKPTKKPMNLKRIIGLITSCEFGNKIGCGIIATNAKNALMAGITTVRAVGGISNYESRVRTDIEKGKRIGPRILTSNMAISVPGGHMAGTFAYEAHSADEARSLVDEIAKTKPSLIKLMITGGIMDSDKEGVPGALLMPESYIKAACDRAHELGYLVAAHCEGPEGVRAALKNGVDTIEHGAKPDDEIISLFIEKGAAQVITLSPALPYTHRLPGLFNLSEAAVKNSEIVVAGMIELAKECRKKDIPVGLGTDTGCSYVTAYDLWRELYYYAKYLETSNAEAIHAGTLLNAIIAGIGDITGSIEVNKMADFIAVEKNPLEDLKALRDVKLVVFEGACHQNPKVQKFEQVESVLDANLL